MESTASVRKERACQAQIWSRAQVGQQTEGGDELGKTGRTPGPTESKKEFERSKGLQGV